MVKKNSNNKSKTASSKVPPQSTIPNPSVPPAVVVSAAAPPPSTTALPSSLRDPVAPSLPHIAKLISQIEACAFSSITSPSDVHWTLKCLQTKYGQAGKSLWWWIFDDSVAVIARSLTLHSYCILDSFLGVPSTKLLLKDVTNAWTNGKLDIKGGLTDGREGRNNVAYSNGDTRGDYIGWFDGKPEEGWTIVPKSAATAYEPGGGGIDLRSDAPPDSLPGYLLKVSTLVSELKPHLPSELANIISRSRAMVTCHPPGARYAKHVDNGRDDGNGNGRRLTILLYLNLGWKEGDGGELAIYNKDDKNECVRVVEPVGDRVVIFWSDRRVPHEVLESHKDRFTVTTWFFDGPEWEEAKRKGIIPPGLSPDEATNKDKDNKDEDARKTPTLHFTPHDDDAAREPEGKGVLPLETTSVPFVDLATAETSATTTTTTTTPESEAMQGLKLAEGEPSPWLPPPLPPPAPTAGAANVLSFTQSLSDNGDSYVIFVPLPVGVSVAATTIDADSTMVKIKCAGMEPEDGIVVRLRDGDGDVGNIKAKFSKKKNVGLTITVPRKK